MKRNIKSIPSTATAFLVACGLLISARSLIHGQFTNVTVTNQISGGTTGGSFLWDSTGKFIVSCFPLDGGLPDNAALYFDPTKVSLRVSDWWDEITYPSGFCSASFGSSIATGDWSFASGGAHASALNSSAFGGAGAYGEYSFAAGAGLGIGAFSATFNIANALGELSFASGSSYAIGKSSFSGVEGAAEGDFSASIGLGTVSQAFCSIAVGRYNLGQSSILGRTTWIATDPLFEIGNGTSTQPSNAVTVYKNGNVIISKRQGDILMGEFGN